MKTRIEWAAEKNARPNVSIEPILTELMDV